MKHKFCLILTIMTMVLLFGCKNNAEDFESPVHFYYKCNPISFFTNESVIDVEIRETKDYNKNTLSILNAYMAGPISDQVISPFPTDARIEEIARKDSTFVLLLNSSFSELTGVDLSIACACITKTVASLTSCERVEIQIKDSASTSITTITMSADDIYTFDSAARNNQDDSL